MQNRILWAIVGTLLPEGKFDADAVTQSGLFLLRQKARLPDFIRMPMAIATLAFGFGSVAVYGKPFFDLTPPQRSVYLSIWASSPLGPLRDYVRLIQSLAMLRAHEC